MQSEHAEGVAMKRSLIMASLLLLAAVSAHAGPHSKSQTGVVEEIRKVDQERIRAQVNADSVALDRIYADDFIGVGPSGTLRTKKEVLADFASGSLRFQSITTDDVRIRVYGNAAVETGLSTMKGQDAEKIVPEENRFTRVWIKQGSRWRLVSNHYSNLAKQH
jgi:ketosteroid isomerase-like protein